MKNILTKLQNFRIEYFLKKPSTDSILLWFGVASWLTSMVAQDIAIITNKNIPADQKKFLLPQETADGLCNTAMLIAFTTTMKKLVYGLFDKGKLLSEQASKAIDIVSKKNGKTREEIFNILTNQKGTQEQKSLFKLLKNEDTLDFGINAILDEVEKSGAKGEGITDAKNKVIKDVAKTMGKTYEEVLDSLRTFKVRDNIIQQLGAKDMGYFPFRNGLGTIVAIVGGIFAANIFAPIFRNNVGVLFKQRADREEYEKNPYPRIAKTISATPYPKSYKSFSNISNITNI